VPQRAGKLGRLATPAWWLLLAVVTLAAAWWARAHNTRVSSDWTIFEVGARSLVHYHGESTYAGSPWHVYVDNSDIQIGPPALWLLAAFEGLSFTTIFSIFSVVMPVIGGFGVAAAALTGYTARLRRPLTGIGAWLMVAASGLVAGIWAYDVAKWRHLDDLLALSLAAGAAYLISRDGPWWLIGIMLGTGIAAKPWAVILAPVLLGLPRRHRPWAALATILAAAAWWGPFVVAAPDTITSLGHYAIEPDPGSVLHLIGIRGNVEGWLRPVQFMLGLGVAALVATRRWWVAAPLAALATRVLTDPYAYGYYGLGPVLFALMYDCAGRGWRRLPTFTVFTVCIEFLLPYVVHQPTVIGVSKLVWAATILIVVLHERPAEPARVGEPA
jgi:FtsH-binding integral membrane protein